MSSKRHSVLPTIDRHGPRPPVNFSSSITISDNAVMQGTHSVTVQSEAVVHPRSHFDSNLGSILVGRRCIIQERVRIGARPEDLENTKPGGVSLGEYVVVEIGSVIESGDTEIGEGCTIQAGSRIGSGAKIGKVGPHEYFYRLAKGQDTYQGKQYCTITHRSVIAPGEVIPDHTVVYSNGKRRKDKRDIVEMRKYNLLKQISLLRKLIPNNPEKFK